MLGLYKIKKGAGSAHCINKPNYLQSYRECLVLVFAKILHFIFLSMVLWLKSEFFEFYMYFYM